jgi:P63C domain
MLALDPTRDHYASIVDRRTPMNDQEEALVGRAKGGKARMELLSGEERQEQARKGAAARWKQLPLAVCGSPEKPLKIGDAEIQCYVLEDGTRVLSQAEFLEALGRHRKANVRNEGGEERLPAILQGKAINPFISQEVIEKSRPIIFRTPNGVRASGYRAELLPDVCEIYLKARDAHALPKNQIHVAQQAEILVRGLARVGIIALVDEATGYQEFRKKNDLSKILEAFIAKELQPWIQTFPNEYYEEMFRLRGLRFPNDTPRRPQYFGHLTNDIVYKRLAPAVLEELKKVTPKTDSGYRQHKYFQRLTNNVGYPKLKEHLGAVVAFMQTSANWGDFMEKLERFKPRYGETLELDLAYPQQEDDGKGL